MAGINVGAHILLIGGSFALFAVLHSLTAGVGLRDHLARLLGERAVRGTYRLAYNLVSVITILIPLALAFSLPDTILYRAAPPLSYVLRGIQLIGVAGVIAALLQTDVLSFAGLRQFGRLLNGKDRADAPARLQTGGLYRWMRHPLYVFSLLAIWALPVMKLNILIFNAAATLYFLLGSLIEERRLEGYFGDEYRQYRRRVGWLMPRPGAPRDTGS